jgi:molybdopterin-containing oxidoreductase family membrane subunit
MEAKTLNITEDISGERPQPQWFKIGMIIGGIMLGALLFAMARILFVGHSVFASSNEVPWNILVVYYAYGISSIGLSYIASLGLLFGIKSFDVFARRALFLAAVLAVPAMLGIILDMGKPLRAPYILWYFSPSSALGIVAASINIYVVLIVAELYFLIKRGMDDRLVKILAIGTFLSATIAHSHLGSIFGLTTAKDLWAGPYYPLYFLLSAFTTSAAIIIPVTVYTYRATGRQIGEKLGDGLLATGKLLAGLIAISMIFLYWKLYSGFYAGKPEVKMLFTGAYAFNFWFFEVLIGFLIPFFMLLVQPSVRSAKKFNSMAVASLLALVGLFVSRYDFVITGQLIPSNSKLLSGIGSGGDYLTQLAVYTPNLTEILTGVGLFGMVWAAYLLGVRYLPLDEGEK